MFTSAVSKSKIAKTACCTVQQTIHFAQLLCSKLGEANQHFQQHDSRCSQQQTCTVVGVVGLVGVQFCSPFLRLAHKGCHGIWSGSPTSLPLSLLRLGIKANRASPALGCQLYCCCILSVNSVMQLARLMLHLDLILLQIHVGILQKLHNA